MPYKNNFHNCNSRFVYRPSLQNCRNYVSHMQAILHVCQDSGEDMAKSLHQIMSVLDMELQHNLETMG